MRNKKCSENNVSCSVTLTITCFVIDLVNRAIVHIHFLLTVNQNKEYINVYIHIIQNVNVIDLLWLVGKTLVLT